MTDPVQIPVSALRQCLDEESLRDWVQQQRQLVELVRPGREARLHERDEQQWVLAERDPLDDVDPGHGA